MNVIDDVQLYLLHLAKQKSSSKRNFIIKNIHDKDSIKYGDLVEIKIGSDLCYISQVEHGTLNVDDLFVYFRDRSIMLYESDYNVYGYGRCQGTIKKNRECIYAVYRKDDEDNYNCIWKKSWKNG